MVITIVHLKVHQINDLFNIAWFRFPPLVVNLGLDERLVDRNVRVGARDLVVPLRIVRLYDQVGHLTDAVCHGTE